MVATSQLTIAKNVDKIPASSVGKTFKHAVSPTSSPPGTSEELLALRAKNTVLTEALAAIHESATKELKQKYDLVWFAKYRYRHPNHEASERIDIEHKEDIKKLRGADGDYYHGFNSGVLAAVRMFKEKADILHINQFEELSPDFMAEAVKHSQKIESARNQFPHTEVTNDFHHQK